MGEMLKALRRGDNATLEKLLTKAIKTESKPIPQKLKEAWEKEDKEKRLMEMKS